MAPETATIQDRRHWLSVLARAEPERLIALMAPFEDTPTSWLRPPEVGTVMVRGRAGGTGAAFNLGEMTVSRAVLKLTDGTTGHGHVQGRSRKAAGLAALADALCQTGRRAEIETAVLTPLRAEREAAATATARKAAATRVEFFTLARGESP